MTSKRMELILSRGLDQDGDEGVPEYGGVSVWLINRLHKVISHTMNILTKKDDAFIVQVDGDVARVMANESGRQLRRLSNVFFSILPMKEEILDAEGKVVANNNVYPYIRLITKKINNSSFLFFMSRLNERMEKGSAEKVASYLNSIVAEARSEAASEGFKKSVASYSRSSNKNYKALIHYVESLFECYSRMLVLRVDFGYTKDNSSVGLDVVAEDLNRFLENRRSNGLFKWMVGYVWKLEYARKKGFHYHMVFFFNGAHVREDVVIAKMVGEYWRDVVTRGRGIYHNCNADKARYKRCGIGMMKHDDGEMREGLHDALQYITKSDKYMKLQVGKRCMGKGEPPKAKDARGRPRKNDIVEA
ncbi:YagK/YfjJ domain-containing protein [Halopseudomonas pelagia]|uniref:YagK/YfjJ domain-containing protein n=1 Tax=Halopseudomonas pelagia TaxID=553151 RepID=UPI0030D83E41